MIIRRRAGALHASARRTLDHIRTLALRPQPRNAASVPTPRDEFYDDLLDFVDRAADYGHISRAEASWLRHAARAAPHPHVDPPPPPTLAPSTRPVDPRDALDLSRTRQEPSDAASPSSQQHSDSC